MTVEGFGISIDVPSDWGGAIYRTVAEPEAPGSELTILQAANFPLPTGDDDLGGKARAAMSTYGVHATLLEWPMRPEYTLPLSPFEPVEPPLQLRFKDFQETFERVPPEHIMMNRLFLMSGRAFQLRIEFGTRQPDAAVLGAMNQALSTVSITPP